MPEQTPVTVGEFTRTVERVEKAIREGFDRIERGMVTRGEYEADQESTRQRLDTLEERSRWTSRYLAVSIAAPLIVAIILAFVLSKGG